MKIKSVFISVVSLVFALTLAGCGGGSSSPAKTTGVSGTSKGAITALGSIFVNGVEYVTTGSSVTADKSSGLESDLRIGRVVTVKGAQSDDLHGSAMSIEYKDNLEGPIDVAPNLVNNTFQALGQTVAVNTTAANVAAGKTVFNGFTTLSQLTVNSIVEVSGMPDANGVIQATYVELKGTLISTTPIELKGTIAIGSLNTTARTFKIGALTVDYTTATLSDLPANGITEGLYVQVSGTGSNYTPGVNPTFKATKIESDKEDANGTEGNKLSVEGFVTGFTGGTTFKVNGQAVNIGTLSLTNIVMTKKVEVEGTLSNGVLMATKIKMSS